jgi:FKBP-type peptidyl-prolyl cis-trans isomerase
VQDFNNDPAIMVSALLLFVLLFIAVAFCSADDEHRQDGRCINGAAATTGDKVLVHYSGYIDESSAAGVHGKMFDSSLKRKRPFDFKLGAGQVIKGWEEG